VTFTNILNGKKYKLLEMLGLFQTVIRTTWRDAMGTTVGLPDQPPEDL
jgi:hypothetical protein